MTGKNVLLAALIIMLVMVAGLDVNFYDRGRVKQKTTREYVNTTVRIEIWDQATVGTKLYTKDGTATNGRWNIAVGPVELEYGKQYWKEYTIGGEDADFNGAERQPFYALHGGIKTGYLITDTSADLVVDTTNNRVGINKGTPAKTLDVDGDMGVTGDVTLTSSTASTNKDTGALVVEGGVGVEKNLYVGGSLTVTDGTNDLDVASHDGSNGLKLAGTLVTATAAELNYVDVTPGTATASKAVVLDGSSKINSMDITTLKIGGTTVTSTAAELNYLDVTAGTAAASKAVVLDGSSKINSMDITTLKIGGTTVTSTAAELNYVDVTAGTAAASKAVVLDANSKIDTITVDTLKAVDNSATGLVIKDNAVSGSNTYITFDSTNAAEKLVIEQNAEIKTGKTLNVVDNSGLKIAGTAISATAAELNIIDGVTASTEDINAITNFEETVSATTSEVSIKTGKTINIVDVSGLEIGGTAVSATAAELNILDGVTATFSELNILDGVTATFSELNIIDGVTASTEDINAITNFEETVSATTSEVSIKTGKTINIVDVSGLEIGGTAVSATAAELNYVDVTAGTATASKAVVLDGSSQIDTISISGALKLTPSQNPPGTPSAGWIYVDTAGGSADELCFYDGSAWQALSGTDSNCAAGDP